MALTSWLNSKYQITKNIIHALQALLMFVAAMITIAIFTQGGPSDGRISYFFALSLISILFLLYQTIFPTFQRSKRFSNAYAHAITDIMFAILWFAAFIGEVVWAKDGTQAGKDFKDGDSICQVFGFGPTSKCNLGQITMWFGVVVFILFIITSALSTYALLYYRRNGTMPGSKSPKDAEATQSDDLEFNGASPDAYNQLQHHAEQQEMQQQQPPHTYDQFQQHETTQQHSPPPPPPPPPPPEAQHAAALPSPALHPDNHNRGSAILPPRPIYPKAPRTPLRQEFDDPAGVVDYHLGASSQDHHHEMREYDNNRNMGPGAYGGNGYNSISPAGGHYAVPTQRRAELPAIRVDTGFGYGSVAFPAGDYSR